jgi:hypothetical protein
MRKMPEDRAELDAEDHIKAHKITTVEIYKKFANGTCTHWQPSARSESSSLSSTRAAWEGLGGGKTTVTAFFWHFPLARATAKIFSHCLSFNFKTMAMRSDVEQIQMVRPSRVSMWSPQFAFDYSFQGFLGFTILPVSRHEIARFAYISYHVSKEGMR